MAAEYIVSSGNPNVILCERGIRTFETYTRNTLDLAAVPLLHHLTHLPVIVDPTHATGKRWLVRPLAIGGVAVGADGVMVEVHPDPDEALSDAEQQLDLEAVPGPDDRHRPGPRARPRAARGPERRSARRRVPATAPGWPSIERRDRLRSWLGRGRRPPGRAPARRTAPARRQVGQPPRPAARRDGRGREPDHRGRRRRGRPLDGRDRASARRDGGTRPRGRPDGRLSGRLAGRRRTPATRGDAGLRQLRHEPAADERDPRRPAADGHPGRRRFVARPSGGSYHRTAALDGGGAPCPAERFPSSPDRDRSYPAGGHRLHHPGPERSGEVGGPAGRPPGGRSDDGPRVDRHAGSHGTDAALARRARGARRRTGSGGDVDGPRRDAGAGGR